MKLKKLDLDNFDRQLDSYSLKAFRQQMNCLAANVNKIIDVITENGIKQNEMTLEEAFILAEKHIKCDETDCDGICESCPFDHDADDVPKALKVLCEAAKRGVQNEAD